MSEKTEPIRSAAWTTWTIGVCAVGLTDSKPADHHKRPDLCASVGHPGATYHPQMDRTWCLCGDVIRDGNHATHEDCCCGGRLIECLHEEQR